MNVFWKQSVRFPAAGAMLAALAFALAGCAGGAWNRTGDGASADGGDAGPTAGATPKPEARPVADQAAPAPSHAKRVEPAPAAAAKPIAAAPAANKQQPPTVRKTGAAAKPPSPRVRIEAIPPKKPPPPPDTLEAQRAQMSEEIYATIRVSMEVAIEQRKEFLAAGKKPDDPEVVKLETTIRNARRLLQQHGESVDDVVPPLPEPSSTR